MNFQILHTRLVNIRLITNALCILLITPVCAFSQPASKTSPIVISVNTDHTVCKSYMGLGVQWDPGFVDYSPEQWNVIFQRVSIIKPQFIRCCMMATSYCTGFNANGQPEFNWDSPDMKRLYPILSYCQAHNITVLLGEWAAPFGMQIDDPRWSTIIADGLKYLIFTRGYTCIRLYNKQNEPTGDAASFAQWSKSQLSLHQALVRANLSRFVQQVAPDTSGEELFPWVQMCATQIPQIVGAYELHWYATDNDITSDHVESALRGVRKMINHTDPHGNLKPFFLGESGTSDTLASQTGNWKNGDSNILIRTPRYGTLMADYAVQTMRAGLAGMSVWDLDDAMHIQMDGETAPTAANPNGYNLKVWGFWNTLGPEMGDPSDSDIRPWFYAWTMLSRHFPRGSKIVLTNNPDVQGLRSSAAIISKNGALALSVALVNDSDTSRTVRLVVPNATGKLNIFQFDYSSTLTRATDTGLPLIHRNVLGIRLNSGLVVHLPANSLVVLSTLRDGMPLKLTTGKVAHTSSISLISADGTHTILRGTSLQFDADVQPDQVPVTWKVSSLNGTPTTVAVVDRHGLVTGLHTGTVLLLATSSAPGSMKSASITLHITNSKTLTDNLTNWTKMYSHSSSLVFDKVHAEKFQGQAVRLKRITDKPQSVVYKLVHLSTFSIKVFYTGSFGDQVKIAVSKEGVHWTDVDIVRSAPVANGMFKPTHLTPASQLPPANYLRITLQDNATIYAPQLAKVTLKASVGAK